MVDNMRVLVKSVKIKNSEYTNRVEQTSFKVARYPSKNEYTVWIGIGSLASDTTKLGLLTRSFNSKHEAIKYANSFKDLDRAVTEHNQARGFLPSSHMSIYDKA